MGIWTVCLSAALIAAGCSLLVETDRQQCRSDHDCGSAADAAPYQCLDGLCRARPCSSDLECQAGGALICEAQTCAPALCVEDSSCTIAGETCMAGRCVDPLFGCFDRLLPSESPEPALFKVKVIGYVDHQPLKSLHVSVCALGDTSCITPLPNSYHYDSEGLLTIAGLDNGNRYAIRMRGVGADGTELMEAEYYQVRPMVGLTEPHQRIELVSREVVELLALMAGSTYDPQRGLIFATFFGCGGQRLAEISLSDNRPAIPYYFTGTANRDVSETDAQGQAGFVNMEVGNGGVALLHKLSIAYQDRSLFAVSVAPRPGVLTLVDIDMLDYGTTLERNEAFRAAKLRR